MKRIFYIAVFAISCSVFIYETILLKFSIFKMSSSPVNSPAYLIISIAFLGIGAAGVYLYLNIKKESFHRIKTSLLWNFSTAYASSIPLSIILFAILPFLQSESSLLKNGIFIFLHVFIISIPFFLSGVCIAYILSIEKLEVGKVIFFDLTGAALGCILSILLLRRLGAYGVAALSVLFAYLAIVIFRFLGERTAITNRGMRLRMFLPALSCFILLAYPNIMKHFNQFDIIYTPAQTQIYSKIQVIKRDFHGLEATYWNPIGRVDLSKEGESNDGAFLYGLSDRYASKKYPGRFILLSSGGGTRQFRIDGDIVDNKFLEHFLFSIPYRIKNNIDNVLIIGPGGGLDVLIGKYFKAKHIDAVDINPDIIDILNGRNKNDKMSSMYSDLTSSNNQTEVRYYTEEGRAFISRNSLSKYDIVQLASATILSSSPLMSEGAVTLTSYLYTQEAIGYYWNALRSNGYIQISHGFSSPYALRLFITILDVLSAKGVEHPERSLMVISCREHTNFIIKKGWFSDPEIKKIKEICEEDKFGVFFSPDMNFKSNEYSIDRGIDNRYYILASQKESRKKVIQSSLYNLEPTSDNKPFFYSIYQFKISKFFKKMPMQSRVSFMIILIGLILSFLFILLPLILDRFKSARADKIPSRFLFFFCLAGIAFSLIEVIILQKFTIFIGGPFYSMCIILPAILIFYSLGALYAAKNKHSNASLLIISAMSILLCGMMGHFFFDKMSNFFFHLTHFSRIILSVAVILPLSFFLGFPLPIALEYIKTKFDKGFIPLAWGISSCGSVIGALFFPIFSQMAGFNLLLLISCILYFLIIISLRGSLPN